MGIHRMKTVLGAAGTLFVVSLLQAVPARAADTSCASDTDCAQGEVCLMTPCARPMDCSAGEECGTPLPCETAGVCSPAPWDGRCAADGDCPTGFACVEVQIPCATAACAPCACACESGKECPPCECPPCEEPPPCEPITEKYCQFQPKDCATDADCGEGWKCIAEEVCNGGSACICPSCPEGAECPECDCPPPEPSVCEVTGHWCGVAETPCDDSAACPVGFQCVSRVSGADCACTPCMCDPASGPCECPACECPDPVDESVCLPEGWDGVGYGGTTPLPEPGTLGGNPETVTTDEDGKVDDGTTPPTTPGTESQTGGTRDASAGTAGCSASARPSVPAALVLLFIAGLLPVARRRLSR